MIKLSGQDRAIEAGFDQRRWIMLPIILTATFMAIFDFFVVNVAAPSIGQDLHSGSASLELVVGGYAFAYATGLVTGGRLGDLFGYRRLFLIGVSAFSVASLLCGLALSPAELVVARLAQGLTAALMVPQVLGLITSGFPGSERRRALAWFGAAMGLGSVAGQVLGGLLVQADLFGLGWRVIFLVNVPVGVLTVGMALALVPRATAPVRRHLDLVGAGWLSGALGLALVPLVLGSADGWPAWGWACLGAAAPMIAGFLWWERRLGSRGGEPLVDLGLFADRAFVSGLAVNVAFYAFFGSFMLGLTEYLQSGLRLGPLQAGLTFGPLGVVFALASVFGRRLAERWGVGVIWRGVSISTLGLAVMLAELALGGTGVGAVALIPAMMAIGLGNGLVLPSLIGAVLSGVHPERAGTASGVLVTAQQFASATGVAVLGVVFFGSLGAAPDSAALVRAMGRVLVMDLALTALALGLCRWLPSAGRAPLAIGRPAGSSGRPVRTSDLVEPAALSTVSANGIDDDCSAA